MKPTAHIGRPPKPPRLRKTRRLQLLLNPAEHRALTRYVQERDTTVSELVRAYIRSLIGQTGGAD
jgi:hypothetical protein